MNYIGMYVYDDSLMIEYLQTPHESNTIDLFESKVSEFKEWLKAKMPTYYTKCMVRNGSSRYFNIEKLSPQSEAFAYYLMDNV